MSQLTSDGLLSMEDLMASADLAMYEDKRRKKRQLPIPGSDSEQPEVAVA
ncbi:MAG TPA: hypothetical protein DCK93_20105 [Blastocatellia bacterium]|nr:hypothetical protein [Blastocatellia bacterium]